uniref:Uncharacterized protein n=1 Tax=Glossina pallidipes TaxID=7398 RepID=A0A1A9ZU98_GLOPL
MKISFEMAKYQTFTLSSSLRARYIDNHSHQRSLLVMLTAYFIIYHDSNLFPNKCKRGTYNKKEEEEGWRDCIVKHELTFHSSKPEQSYYNIELSCRGQLKTVCLMNTIG